MQGSHVCTVPTYSELTPKSVYDLLNVEYRRHCRKGMGDEGKLDFYVKRGGTGAFELCRMKARQRQRNASVFLLQPGTGKLVVERGKLVVERENWWWPMRMPDVGGQNRILICI